MDGIISNMFDCWVALFVHLLALKSSMDTLLLSHHISVRPPPLKSKTKNFLWYGFIFAHLLNCKAHSDEARKTN